MAIKHNNINKFKCGFVAIVGGPNAGKSTLLNSILGQKISITSKKPQTTRNRITGILTKSNFQFIFIDTPGIHKALSPLNTRIVELSFSTILDVDIVLLIIDASKNNLKSEELLINKLNRYKKPVVLAINKIDRINKKKILETISNLSNLYQFNSIIPISAIQNKYIDTLMDSMEKILPIALPMFPTDTLTVMSEEFIISEIIREKAFRITGQEVPYSLAVTIDIFEKKQNKSNIYICATIHVERDSQKGIIIGKNGQKIKEIGKESRLKIQNLLKTKILLKLFTRVQKNWSKDTKALERFGY